jgi:hypothetical protein
VGGDLVIIATSKGADADLALLINLITPTGAVTGGQQIGAISVHGAVVSLQSGRSNDTNVNNTHLMLGPTRVVTAHEIAERNAERRPPRRFGEAAVGKLPLRSLTPLQVSHSCRLPTRFDLSAARSKRRAPPRFH